MMPVVFTIPGVNISVPGFGFALMIAFLLSIWWAVHRAQRSGGNPDVILNVGFVALIAGVVGCRAMHVVHYWEQDFAHQPNVAAMLWAIVDLTRGGMEYYGGFVLSVVCTLGWLRFVEKVSLRWYMDIIAPSAMLGLAIGRVGCLLNGCCYGSTCEKPWAIQFPYGSPASLEQWQAGLPGSGLPGELMCTYPFGVMKPISRESMAAGNADIEQTAEADRKLRGEISALEAKLALASGDEKKKLTRELDRQRAASLMYKHRYYDIRDAMESNGLTAAQVKAIAARHPSLAVHPTQVYSTLTAGLLALALSALYWRRSRDGVVIGVLLVIEPITRYLLEVIRADNPIDTLGRFTISQSIAMGMSAVGVVYLMWLRTRAPRSVRAAVWTPPEEPPAKAKPARA